MKFKVLGGVLAGGLLLLAAMVGAPGGVGTALALTNCNVSDLTVDAEERAFLTLINNYRAQNGAGPLTISANLNRAASWMAVDLANKNYFSHTDSSRRSFSTRLYNCDVAYAGVGENIAAGTYQDTAQEIFAQWKASPGHDANMKNGSYKQIGIARAYNANSTYKWYWVTDFSTVTDGTNLGGGTSTTQTATATQTTSPTATPTTAPATSTKAVLTSPTPGSQLTGTTATFKWNPATNGSEYFFYLGTSKGANNLYGKSQGKNLQVTLSNLPSDGRTLYVRLWTRSGTTWTYNDYTYRAAP